MSVLVLRSLGVYFRYNSRLIEVRVLRGWKLNNGTSIIRYSLFFGFFFELFIIVF